MQAMPSCSRTSKIGLCQNQEVESFIALGSNIEQREEWIKIACQELFKSKSVQLVEISSLYETEPIDCEEKDFFLNGVMKVKTKLKAQELLKLLHAVEAKLGRERKKKHAPRKIDLDLILYGKKLIKSKELTLPHPRAHLRSFVMQGLAELAAEQVYPGQELSIQKLYQKLKAKAHSMFLDQEAAKELISQISSYETLSAC